MLVLMSEKWEKAKEKTLKDHKMAMTKVFANSLFGYERESMFPEVYEIDFPVTIQKADIESITRWENKLMDCTEYIFKMVDGTEYNLSRSNISGDWTFRDDIKQRKKYKTNPYHTKDEAHNHLMFELFDR
jgi:hypothetical protein